MSRAYYGIQTGAAFFQGMMDAFNRATAMQADIAKFEKQYGLEKEMMGLRRQELDLRQQEFQKRMELAEKGFKMDEQKFQQAVQSEQHRRMMDYMSVYANLTKAHADWYSKLTDLNKAAGTKLSELLQERKQAIERGEDTSQLDSQIGALANAYDSERNAVMANLNAISQQAALLQQFYQAEKTKLPDAPDLPEWPAAPTVPADLKISSPVSSADTTPSGPSASAQGVPYTPAAKPTGALDIQKPYLSDMINPATGSKVEFVPGQIQVEIESGKFLRRDGKIVNEKGAVIGDYPSYYQQIVQKDLAPLYQHLTDPEKRAELLKQIGQQTERAVLGAHETSTDREQFAQAIAQQMYETIGQRIRDLANQQGIRLHEGHWPVLNDYLRSLAVDALDSKELDFSKFWSPERADFKETLKKYLTEQSLPGGFIVSSELDGKPVAYKTVSPFAVERDKLNPMKAFALEDFDKHSPGWLKDWDLAHRLDVMNVLAPTPAKYNDYLNSATSRFVDYLNKNPMAAQAVGMYIHVVDPDGRYRQARWPEDKDAIVHNFKTYLRYLFARDKQAPDTFFGFGSLPTTPTKPGIPAAPPKRP